MIYRITDALLQKRARINFQKWKCNLFEIYHSGPMSTQFVYIFPHNTMLFSKCVLSLLWLNYVAAAWDLRCLKSAWSHVQLWRSSGRILHKNREYTYFVFRCFEPLYISNLNIWHIILILLSMLHLLLIFWWQKYLDMHPKWVIFCRGWFYAGFSLIFKNNQR